MTLATGITVVIAHFSFNLQAAKTQPTQVELSKYKLVFDDEFNGNKLDASKWVTCYDWFNSAAQGCSNNGNNELEWYVKNQVEVSGGTLRLKAIASATSGTDQNLQSKTFPYKSGMISTGRPNPKGTPKWTNTYGYYEARIYAPGGKGVWPAFWLLPGGTKWPPEIDIMELIGSKPKDLLTTYFWNNADMQVVKNTSTYISDNNFTDSWHTYGVNWQKGMLEWYVDGKEVRRIESKNVPSENMEMVLNLAIGGNLPGSPDITTHFPATMMVDYVRVYKAD